MDKIFAIFLTAIVFSGVPVFAAGRGPASDSSSSSSSSGGGGKNMPKLPWSELSGGTVSLTQTLDNTHIEHPFGFKASVHEKYGPFHAGIGVLGAIHSEEQQSGTYSQVNVNESVYLTTVNAGIVFGTFLILDAGYGYAEMRRSVSTPYGTPSSTVNTTAHGTGWEAGGTVLPIHTKAVSVGVSYYYFEATGNSYAQDSVTGPTETQTSAPAKVKASGTLETLTLLFNF